ncbi:MAG: hypothetical protein A3G33_10530 [Omnitrophica bacterium RIFCSPLOWO2_12_FULL_44_17]|uniref:ResB-like domain-containing protein n=1 Tax=Candidatus Danuiimicrobium aquiferis TaxID=1801832 RepID=A0A1G1KR89_9BACT|nr:MAG: hypothetical protein A3B72_02845 [Omnitrophica bacterium RIFCSPHIGHO2_02_FULL_45_28]OGW88438.1 MAG: hypothetical protein A3E74_08205 [Omnitrophica bacterium RIFCSPHIGHO2_12_FULL_44_12]OGW95408.1 MAG: hypothetical protein A3G33_10530 [Omnitrophica bacterium RIFCSPLOWO2_12_FULL_44_17]
MAFISINKKATSEFISVIKNLISVRLMVVLLVILIPVAIAGSLIPQGRTYPEYVKLFGMGWTDILYRFHFIAVFKSLWFLILIMFLGSNILGCFLKSIIEKRRSLGFLLVHLSLILLIAAGLISSVGRIKQQVVLNEGQSTESFVFNNKTIPLGFELRLKDFELQRYADRGGKLFISVPGRKMPHEFYCKMKTWVTVPDSSYQFQIERYVADFRYDMGTGSAFSASNEPNNPAVLVHVKGGEEDYSEWVFARFSDFHNKGNRLLKLKYVWAPEIPKSFISRVEIIENGEVVKEQAIEVNHPLRYGRFSIYQASYDLNDEKWSGLDIVKDPGVGLVYTAIILMMLGLIQNIYIRPFFEKKKGR